MTEPPIAIMRTVPTLSLPGKSNRAFLRTVALINSGDIPACYFALPTKPKHDTLHLYIISGNQAIVRFTIAGYEAGDARKCWDGNTRAPGCWVVCTAPELPRQAPTVKGFRGFRYLSEPLW